MKEEVAAAVVFLTRLVRQNNTIEKNKVEDFSKNLTTTLVERFKNHWYIQEPTKGQAYRCIRITEAEPTDPLLEKVAQACGLKINDLGLPVEFTLWIDPHDVTCRFGESMGSSFYTVASVQNGSLENSAPTLDVGEMVRSHQQRKSTELSKLQEAARRRNGHRHKYTGIGSINGLHGGKKYSFHYPGRHHLNHHSHHRSITPINPSPLATTSTTLSSSPTSSSTWYGSGVYGGTSFADGSSRGSSPNQFRWVRNPEMVSAGAQ